MKHSDLKTLSDALNAPYTMYIEYCRRHLEDVCLSDPVIHDVYTANQALGATFFEAAWSRRYYMHHAIEQSQKNFKIV